jgi:hypothetical protein
MDDRSEVLVEMHRLQMLAFIGRTARRAPSITPFDVAEWLRIPVGECSLLVAELAEEGFVDWGSSLAESFRAPIRLTPLGQGVLEWNRRRMARMAEAEEYPTDPPAVG